MTTEMLEVLESPARSINRQENPEAAKYSVEPLSARIHLMGHSVLTPRSGVREMVSWIARSALGCARLNLESISRRLALCGKRQLDGARLARKQHLPRQVRYLNRWLWEQTLLPVLCECVRYGL